MKTNICYLGNCLDVLPMLPDNCVDSICCDPPYELGFMGKGWDNTGIAYSVKMWKECLRVLKPGGHLLSFSGTRTYHRMAVAIEDAGFEVRDMIEWVYGSGFPKSLNIGKAVDKLQGNEREVVGELKLTGTARNTKTIGAKTSSALTSDYEINNTKTDITKGTSEWEGWGTALKPAHEPICLARKPLSEKTVAENVLKYGTGGINIDESRVETSENITIHKGNKFGGIAGTTPETFKTDGQSLGRFPANLIHDNSEEVRECFPETGGGSFKQGSYRHKAPENLYQLGTAKKEGANQNAPDNYGDNGNASRFFKSILYYPKASKSERNKGCEGLEEKEIKLNTAKYYVCRLCGKQKLSGSPCKCENPEWEVKDVKTTSQNNHPTVKPTALMSYLIKMITPPGGVCLDPFAGSGSTLVAAKENGFQYVGIEMTEEYLPIIQARTGCEIIKPENPLDCLTDEFKATGKPYGIGVADKLIELEAIKKDRISKSICPECGGKIKGKYCEDCLKEY